MNDEAQNASLGILIDNVRKNTWHKTIVDQNTVCTNDTMCFHSKRVTCVTQSQHYNHWYMQEDIDPTKWGWQHSNVEGAMVPTPIWDIE